MDVVNPSDLVESVAPQSLQSVTQRKDFHYYSTIIEINPLDIPSKDKLSFANLFITMTDDLKRVSLLITSITRLVSILLANPPPPNSVWECVNMKQHHGEGDGAEKTGVNSHQAEASVRQQEV